MTDPLLHLDGLLVGHRGRPLLPPFQVEIRAGELWAILGPNGSGKTTLLRTLLHLLPPVGGAMRLAPEARVGYVPQRTSLDLDIPARVVDVVEGGVDQGWSFLRPWFLGKHRASVERAMRDTKTLELAHAPFASLSEGQKQRVLMARALAMEPRLLILDEPTSAMDIGAEREVLGVLEALREARDLAVLLVSHHLHVVGAFATHAMLVDKDHQVLLCGPIERIAHHRDCTALYGTVLQEAIAHNAHCHSGPGPCDGPHDPGAARELRASP